MKRIKVLHLIKSLGRGGAEMLLPETLRAHDREHFEFAYGYFVDFKNQVVPDLEALGAEVHCFHANTGAAILLKSTEVARFARHWGADLIHCHLPLAGIAGRITSRITDLPVIYTEHNKQERYHPLTRWANLLTIRWNASVLAVSADVEASLRQAKPGGKVPVRTVLNAVDTAKFSKAHFEKAQVRSALQIPADALVIGTVAVFRAQKRLHLWLELAARLARIYPNVHFVLVGDGPFLTALRQQSRDLGIADRIKFPGRLSDVRPWLAVMDIYLMTSEFEGLPLAMLEAMSMELPVVATAAGGIGEVVRHEREGLLCPVDRYADLFEHLEACVGDPLFRQELGSQARQRVAENFGIERMVRELEAEYLAISHARSKRQKIGI